MSKRGLSQREVAIIRGMWVIKTEERDKLDHFFLIRDTWDNLVNDFIEDEVEYKRFLSHEGKEYEVILMQPVRQLRAAAELGLSFRVNLVSNVRVVLIREWKAVENGEREGTS